jgi:hypothetical protein
MPTNINDKLVSWASEIDEQTIKQAQKTARLPIVRVRGAHARCTSGRCDHQQ